MVKHYCDRCGDLLENDTRIKVRAKISPFPVFTSGIDFEFCKRCYDNAFGCTQQVIKAEEEKRNAEEAAQALHDKVAKILEERQQGVYITDEEGETNVEED